MLCCQLHPMLPILSQLLTLTGQVNRAVSWWWPRWYVFVASDPRLCHRLYDSSYQGLYLHIPALYSCLAYSCQLTHFHHQVSAKNLFHGPHQISRQYSIICSMIEFALGGWFLAVLQIDNFHLNPLLILVLAIWLRGNVSLSAHFFSCTHFESWFAF